MISLDTKLQILEVATAQDSAPLWEEHLTLRLALKFSKNFRYLKWRDSWSPYLPAISRYWVFIGFSLKPYPYSLYDGEDSYILGTNEMRLGDFWRFHGRFYGFANLSHHQKLTWIPKMMGWKR